MEERSQKIEELMSGQPAFRKKQAESALFNFGFNDWRDVHVLPAKLRELLHEKISWMSLEQEEVLSSQNGDVYKALLRTEDGRKIETVLMRNARNNWTVCISSQVGCPIGCIFCATGSMGFGRNLSVTEIVDQVRFWRYYMQRNNIDGLITNVVVMGMGEPMLNYENVKGALNVVIGNTDIGTTKITVSTVGVMPVLEKMLEDKDWPPVKIAISLHSADLLKRKRMIRATSEEFFVELEDWMEKYLNKFGNRNHHLTFEYVMLDSINDQKEDAASLARFLGGWQGVKLNLIPYNSNDCGTGIKGSSSRRILELKNAMERAGIVVTIRQSMGDDISAACGQLAAKNT